MDTDKTFLEVAPPDAGRLLRGPPFYRWPSLAPGAGIATLGLIAILYPAVITVEHDLFVGWLFVASGILGLAALVVSENTRGFLWMTLTAALSLLLGILLVWRPGGAPVSLTVMLSALFIAEGAFQAAISFSSRHAFPDVWGWMLLSGVADLVLASLIMLGWLNTAGQMLEWFVAINLVSSGWAAIEIAMSGCRIEGGAGLTVR